MTNFKRLFGGRFLFFVSGSYYFCELFCLVKVPYNMESYISQ